MSWFFDSPEDPDSIRKAARVRKERERRRKRNKEIQEQAQQQRKIARAVKLIRAQQKRTGEVKKWWQW